LLQVAEVEDHQVQVHLGVMVEAVEALEDFELQLLQQ
jgi:hypothetical protein